MKALIFCAGAATRWQWRSFPVFFALVVGLLLWAVFGPLDNIDDPQ